MRWKTPLRPWIGAEMWIGGRGGSLRRNIGDGETRAAVYVEIGELNLGTAMAATAVIHGDGAGVAERRVAG